jgi:hypothetical protein
MVLVLASAVQISYIVDSFPGFHSSSDCSLCHNEPATAYNSSFVDADITLDGLPNEEFWGDSNHYNTMEFPMASTFGSTHIFVLVKFAQNSTHFFMWIDWEDTTINGTDTMRYSTADGVAVLWNAHPGEYDLKDGWFGGMETDNPGEEVDTWVYKPAAADTGKQSTIDLNAGETYTLTGEGLDTMFDEGGWDDDLDTTQDLSFGSSWGNITDRHEENYGIEFSRPLVTDDPGDVQFDKIGYYEFAIAIWNASSGSSHIMSFEHSVFVYGDCDTDCDIPAGGLTVISYVPTTEVSVVPTTEVTTKTESAPINMYFVLISLFSVAALVRLVPRRKN